MIDEKDLDVIDNILAKLPNVHFISFADLVSYASGNTERANRLKHLLISGGSAQKPKYGDNDGIGKTGNTEEHRASGHYRKLYANAIRESKEHEKLDLEIKALKKNNRLIWPAFLISLISLLASLWALFCKI